MLGDLRVLSLWLIVAIPIVVPLVLAFKRVDRFGLWFFSFALSSGFCYVATLVSNELYEAHIEAQLDRLDHDGDGSWGGSELTPEVEQLMDDWASDTGRTFAPCTGLVIWPIYAGFWHGVIGGFCWAFLPQKKLVK